MKSDELTKMRSELNCIMKNADDFFKDFGALDDEVYADGAISRKNKELMGLAISVSTRCDECILYHLKNCLDCNANKAEIIETIKIGIMAGGSITYPNARFAFKMMKELNIT